MEVLGWVRDPGPEPAPVPTPAPSGGKMNQDEIEKMLASMAASDPEPAPAPAPAPSGGKMNVDSKHRDPVYFGQNHILWY